MKKIISLILILTTLMSFFIPATSVAEEYSGLSEHELGLLNAISYITEEGFSESGIMTRAEFCNMICRLFKYENYASGKMEFRDIDSTHPYYNSVSALYAKGAVKGISKYSMAPNKEISVGEAGIIAVAALGYDTVAETGMTTYFAQASDLGIYDGIAGGQDTSLTEDMALKMMYNILFAPIMLYTPGTDGIDYAMNKDVIMMGEIYDMYEVKGIITENGITSFYGESTIAQNEVRIGTDIYVSASDEISELIGYSVIAYVQKEDKTSDDKVVYAYKNDRKNTELVIASDDIMNADETVIEYEVDDKNKNAKLSSSFDVIYNGIGLADYKSSVLSPVYGSLTLIDNDEDGAFDLVKVTDYKVIIAQSVSSSASKFAVYEKNGNHLNVDLEKVDSRISVWKKNSPADISEITANSVLLVADSGEREKTRVIDIYISTDTAKGVVSKIVEESITIDGKEIENNAYFDYLNAASFAGKEVECYLDYFGRVVYIYSGADGNYGYLFKIIYDEVDETVSAKILTPDNVWHTYKLKEKVKNNGSSIKAVDLYNSLRVGDAAGKIVTQRQIVRFKVNEEEILTELSIARDTYRTDDCDVDEELDELSREKGEFRRSLGKEQRTYAHNIDTRGLFAAAGYNNWLGCFFDGTVPVLVRPEVSQAKPESSITENDIAFYTQSYFKTDMTYMCEGYDLTEGNAIKILVTYADLVPMLDRNDRIVIVDHIAEELDEDDQVVKRLYGWTQGNLVAFESEIDTAFKYGGKDVKPGDVVRLAKNAEGITEEVKEFWFRVDDPITYFSKNENYNDPTTQQNAMGKPKYANCQIAVGRVVKIVGNYLRIQIDGGTEKGRYINIQLRDAASYVVYDSESSKQPLSKGTKTDIGVGDIVVAAMYFAQLRDVVIYK